MRSHGLGALDRSLRVRASVRRAVAFVRADGQVRLALVLAVPSLLWFVFGPLDGQRLGIRVVAPVYASLIAFGQWRLAGDPRLPRRFARFWRVLSLGMFTYTAGMLVDLTALLLRLPLRDAGETLLYPVAGLMTVVALVVFPTAIQRPAERLRLALDGATVLFGAATFVWYFLVSRRWQPADGWRELSDGLVLPALTLVIGFVILRITMVGASVLSKQTTACFVFGAVTAATPIIIGAPPNTPLGRVGSLIHLVAFVTCVVGVALERRRGGTHTPRRVDWRRSVSVLPYCAVAGTLVLLVLAIGENLGYRGWVVVVGVLALCAVVMVRQLLLLWEHSRLLGANHELTERLRYQAYHDHLTGLANRQLFAERVTEALAQDREDGSSTTVLFVDLDDFKVVNDSLGHQAGDELLGAVARRLHGAVPDDALLGRLGGDEFAVLVRQVDDDAGVTARITEGLREPFTVAEVQVRVQASIGIATAHAGSPGTDELLRNADVAMYAAKHDDRGGFRRFETAMLTAMLRRHRLQAALSHAAARGELIVHYQPIVDLVDDTVRGAEALVRWRRPDGDLLPPCEFIPLAEETGLVAEIDRWVLRHACEQAGRWLRGVAADTPFTLHVNVSARQLHRTDLVRQVEQVLRETAVPADRLTLEITESGLSHDLDAAIERMDELVRLGVHLAIDDFGTGYSSLAYLRRMPVHVLKIDKTFTSELRGDTVHAPLAQAVIALANSLGMDTVAEGVETATQADRLLSLGCRYGQGYRYAAALPPERLERLLTGEPVRGTA